MKTQEQEAPAAAVDPMEDLCQALFSTEGGAKKKTARRTVGAMTQRPWPQLPSRLRSAIRSDIGRLLDSGKARAQILEAGYSAGVVNQALRDLGRTAA
ncbi:hypothetical protein M8037_10040 [Sinorhizobium meliloti]|uniref:hypothetical protein n=1 Tax=Rhizobium meliloti TaxID=382 RepID=UPI0020741234|nr:hypothetical protein [Sinorhizobium meliloti]MCM5689137.1 hypothetical protein [Sinorhizobium meliloti]MCO6425449.1 hypothetical protein [Sinorhizobium meliloti]